jgi:hypothetical protein
VDALEAWDELERELFQTWQFLSGASNSDEAWTEYSDLSTGNQQKATRRLVRNRWVGTPAAPQPPKVFERLAHLTTIRDRIVHGRWHPIHDADDGPTEYIRLYDARGEFARPIDIEDEKRTLGRSRFYEPQLRDAEQQFRTAAREVFMAKNSMVGMRRQRGLS